MDNVNIFYEALANSDALKEKATKLNEKYNETEEADTGMELTN